MPAPLVGLAVGAAARIVAKKAAQKALKANARGLKAAKKPTNRTGTKADRAQRAELQGQTNIIKNASPARANRIRGGSLAAQKEYGGFGVATARRTPAQAARQAEITKELNPVRSVRKKATVPGRTPNARALNAAQGKSLASPAKRAVSKKNAEERAKLNSLRNRFKNK